MKSIIDTTTPGTYLYLLFVQCTDGIIYIQQHIQIGCYMYVYIHVVLMDPCAENITILKVCVVGLLIF